MPPVAVPLAQCNFRNRLKWNSCRVLTGVSIGLLFDWADWVVHLPRQGFTGSEIHVLATLHTYVWGENSYNQSGQRGWFGELFCVSFLNETQKWKIYWIKSQICMAKSQTSEALVQLESKSTSKFKFNAFPCEFQIKNSMRLHFFFLVFLRIKNSNWSGQHVNQSPIGEFSSI